MMAKKRTLETASVTSKEEHQPTVVSSADGAKVLKNLDKLVENFENPSVKEENSNREVTEAERKSINPTIIIWYNRTFKSLPITPMLSIQNAQKTAEALNETSKTDPKTT